MTRLLEKAIDAVRQLSSDEQDELARTIMEIVGTREEQPYALSDEDKVAIERSRRAIARGEFATDEQVAAVLLKYER